MESQTTLPQLMPQYHMEHDAHQVSRVLVVNPAQHRQPLYISPLAHTSFLRPITLYYMTNLVGNFHSMPTLKASSALPSDAIAMVDGDQYTSANPIYVTTNVFYRQVRNLVFDMVSAPRGNLVCGIHWPTAQATSLQNLVFKMSTASGNHHVGVLIENGQHLWSFIVKEHC